jgi:hypothetical protein
MREMLGWDEVYVKTVQQQQLNARWRYPDRIRRGSWHRRWDSTHASWDISPRVARRKVVQCPFSQSGRHRGQTKLTQPSQRMVSTRHHNCDSHTQSLVFLRPPIPPPLRRGCAGYLDSSWPPPKSGDALNSQHISHAHKTQLRPCRPLVCEVPWASCRL